MRKMVLISVSLLLSAVNTSLAYAADYDGGKVTLVAASACISGDAGPYDEVASITPGANPDQHVTLRCGDPTKGIIHIVQSHPIADNGADDVNVNACFNHIWAGPYHDAGSDNPNNLAIEIADDSGLKAVLAYDKNTGDVITMYASNNSWADCANLAAKPRLHASSIGTLRGSHLKQMP